MQQTFKDYLFWVACFKKLKKWGPLMVAKGQNLFAKFSKWLPMSTWQLFLSSPDRFSDSLFKQKWQTFAGTTMHCDAFFSKIVKSTSLACGLCLVGLWKIVLTIQRKKNNKMIIDYSPRRVIFFPFYFVFMVCEQSFLGLKCLPW